MNDFFTTEYLITLPGSTLAVVLVVSVLRMLIGGVFEKYALWTALAISAALSTVITLLNPAAPDWSAWVVWFFNIFIIFTSATGANELFAATNAPAAGDAPPAWGQGETWRKSWL